MSKSIKILFTLLLTIMLSGCFIQTPSNEDYINIEELYNENKDVIDSVIANMDIKEHSKRENFEYVSNEVFLDNKFQFSNFKKFDGVRFKYEKIMYCYSNKIVALMFEMKNEQAAKEACKKYKSVNPNNPIFYEKNVVYFDSVAYNLMMKNYYVEDNNYVTLDGNTFLTNLSNNEIIYIPNVEEITEESCAFHTNIKKIYMNTNLEKINYGAFYGCYNLENVYLNDELKQIDMFAFYRCYSLKYVVIPKSVEIIEKHTFSHGTIYCEALEKPEGWDENFAHYQAKIYWGNEWEYNEEGIPVLKNS